MMTRRIFIALALLSLLCISCSTDVPYNSNSGDNGSRALAAAIELNQEVTDDVSAITGDNEDWFFFNPTEQGFVTVSIVVDEPSAISLSISLYDSFGRELQTRESSPDSNIYLLDKFEVSADRFFIAVKTVKGASKYTIKAAFELPVVETPEEVVDENTEVQQASCVPADKCKAGQKCCRPRTSQQAAPTEPAPVSEEISPEAKTIKGTIVLVTPRGDDLSDVKINGIGLKKNVKPGMKAVLRGLKRKVDIYKCLNTSCQATIRATST